MNRGEGIRLWHNEGDVLSHPQEMPFQKFRWFILQNYASLFLGGGGLSIMNYIGKLQAKRVLFKAVQRFIKGYAFHKLKYRKGLGKL